MNFSNVFLQKTEFCMQPITKLAEFVKLAKNIMMRVNVKVPECVGLNPNFFIYDITLQFLQQSQFLQSQFLRPHLVSRIVPHIAAYRQSAFTVADFAAEQAATESARFHLWLGKNSEVAAFCKTEETKSRHLYLSSFIVTPDYRGTGVAQEFLQSVLRSAAGYEKVFLKVHEDNPAAKRLYDKSGFVAQQKWNKRYEMEKLM